MIDFPYSKNELKFKIDNLFFEEDFESLNLEYKAIKNFALKYLESSKKQPIFEICPSSNLKISNEIPHDIINSNLKWVLGSDDRGLMGISLNDELSILKKINKREHNFNLASFIFDQLN